MASMKSRPRSMLVRGWGIGMGIHMVRARVRARVGVSRNMVVEDISGRRGSFVNSFMASAIGCRRPYGPTTRGPLRSCM